MRELNLYLASEKIIEVTNGVSTKLPYKIRTLRRGKGARWTRPDPAGAGGARGRAACLSRRSKWRCRECESRDGGTAGTGPARRVTRLRAGG